MELQYKRNYIVQIKLNLEELGDGKPFLLDEGFQIKN